MAPSTPDGARERIVELDREPGAPPLVPGFPAARQHKVMAGLDTVHFSFDSSTLSEESKAVLRKNAAWLRSHPGISLRLMGHADERGSSEYNLALGLRRAHMVRDYLIELGIAPDGMNSISYGEEMPMKRGHDEASWRVNRRVEFAQAEATAALRR